MSKVYLVSAKRTAIGSMLGSLKDADATWIGAQVLKAVIEDAGIDPKCLDEVVVGNVLPAGLKQGPARQVMDRPREERTRRFLARYAEQAGEN